MHMHGYGDGPDLSYDELVAFNRTLLLKLDAAEAKIRELEGQKANVSHDYKGLVEALHAVLPPLERS